MAGSLAMILRRLVTATVFAGCGAPAPSVDTPTGPTEVDGRTAVGHPAPPADAPTRLAYARALAGVRISAVGGSAVYQVTHGPLTPTDVWVDVWRDGDPTLHELHPLLPTVAGEHAVTVELTGAFRPGATGLWVPPDERDQLLGNWGDATVTVYARADGVIDCATAGLHAHEVHRVRRCLPLHPIPGVWPPPDAGSAGTPDAVRTP